MASLEKKVISAAIISLIIGIGIGYAIAYYTIPRPKPVVTLTVIGPWSGVEMEYFMKVLKAYEREHPNIKIKYIAIRAEDLAAIAPPQFAAGKTPGDVLITPWGWWVASMGEKGHLVDLSELVDKEEFVPGIFDPVTRNDKVYGLPFTAWAKPGFWHRKSFFEKYGLKVPETWEEFKSLLKKIKEEIGITPIASGDGVGWPLSDTSEHFIITFGGPELQLKLIKGEVKWTDPEVRKIFEEYLVPLLKAGYFSEPKDWTAQVDLWWKGKYALYFMGTWITGMVPDPGDLGVFTLPGCKGIVMGTDYISVSKYTPNLEEALKLARWLATEGQRIHVGTKAGKFATWLKVELEEHWEPMRPVYKALMTGEVAVVPDLDDAVGGKWQTTFWDQLKLLWTNPDKLDEVLSTLQRVYEEQAKGK